MSRRAYQARRAARSQRHCVSDGSSVTIGRCRACAEHRILIEESERCAQCVIDTTMLPLREEEQVCAP